MHNDDKSEQMISHIDCTLPWQRRAEVTLKLRTIIAAMCFKVKGAERWAPTGVATYARRCHSQREHGGAGLRSRGACSAEVTDGARTQDRDTHGFNAAKQHCA